VHARAVGAARAELDAVSFETAWTEGTAMPVDRAIACALTLAGPEGDSYAPTPRRRG